MQTKETVLPVRKTLDLLWPVPLFM